MCGKPLSNVAWGDMQADGGHACLGVHRQLAGAGCIQPSHCSWRLEHAACLVGCLVGWLGEWLEKEHGNTRQ